MSTSRGPILRALGKLASGSMLGYISVLALSPVLTRFYTPEEFGTFAVFGAFVAIASIFMSLSLELGILGARTRPEAVRFGISATASALVIALVFLGLASMWLASPLVAPLPGWAIYAAILSCFVAVMTTIGINWAIRRDKSGRAAWATFGSLGGRSSLQAGFGVGLGGLEGLVLGELLGRILGWALAEDGVFRLTIRRLVRTPLTVARHAFAAKSYAIYVTPATAVETALVWLPSPLFTLMFDPVAGGFVALVQRFGSAPLTIANQSVGQLFHREAARVIGQQNSRLLRFVLGFGLVALPIVLALIWLFWAYGAQIAGAVFGEQWQETGLVVLVFLPLFYLQFLSLLTNRIILILQYMRFKLMASLLHLSLVFISLGIAMALDLPWQHAIMLYSGVLTVSHAGVFVVVLILLACSSQSRIAPHLEQ